MSRTVHVVQGSWAAGCFVEAMQPQSGELLVNEDVLSCGPLPNLRSIDDWARSREAFWDSVAPGGHQRPFNHDLLGDYRAFSEADSIVLWIGVGAAEQLLLAWMVQLLKLIGAQAQLRVVQFTRGKYNTLRFPGIPTTCAIARSL